MAPITPSCCLCSARLIPIPWVAIDMIQYQFNGFSIIFKLAAGTVFSRGSSVVRYK